MISQTPNTAYTIYTSFNAQKVQMHNKDFGSLVVKILIKDLQKHGDLQHKLLSMYLICYTSWL